MGRPKPANLKIKAGSFLSVFFVTFYVSHIYITMHYVQMKKFPAKASKAK